MKIQENKIKEHNGTSFSITKKDGISILRFSDECSIDNIEDYATIMLGECTNCEKVKELYEDFTYDKVLVLGLGLGLVPETLKVEKGCSVVDVIDNNQELIDYVDFIDESINVIKHDALTYTPDKKYDFILVDLWWGHEDITQEVIDNIENNYKPYLEDNGKILIPILYKSFKK
tara:strand:- start:2797 stop:3318 length:522 start_codon:yes stop_codon:yes gene_type:complete